MARLIDVDAFRREFGFAEECRDCKRIAKWECASQMYSARDICGWLDDTPTVGGWISVEDRLPKPYEEVFFIGKNGFGNWYPIQKGFRIQREWYSSIHATVIDCVTHWMPLPKLPEEVSGNG